MILLPIGLLAAPAAGGSLLLDAVPCAAAFSTRRLRSAYAGPALRVRRSTDNAELDVGFAGNDLGTAALAAFVGSGNGSVSKWYDQSGNGRDAYQATAASQPLVASAGAVETQGGRPALSQLAAGAFLLLPAGTFAGLTSSTAICAFRSGNGVEQGWWQHTGSGQYSHTPWSDGVAYEGYLSTARRPLGPYGATDAPTVHTASHSGSELSVFRNGAQVGAAQAVGFSTGANGQNDGGFSRVALSEVILTASALSASTRQTIERSMGAYFGITVA